MFQWFEDLFGFVETPDNYSQTQGNFILESNDSNLVLTSKVNNRSFPIGQFTTPSLKEIRNEVDAIVAKVTSGPGEITYEHRIITDALELHSENPGATFQVASQFNCLEFPYPETTPEDGVTCYSLDNTQGPACALACAAGAVYRNYFVNLNGDVGQHADSQINCISRLESALPSQFWTVTNGYIESDDELLTQLFDYLTVNREKTDEFVQAVQVGLHTNVGVTFKNRYEEIPEQLLVHQVYCSAISCAYSGADILLWEPLAKIVLDAVYEATILIAIMNRARGGSKDVFLTFVGGGAFGNKPEWIASSISRAIQIARTYATDIHINICHFRSKNRCIAQLVDSEL